MSSVIDENGNVIGGMRYPDEERRQKEFEERLRSGIPEPVGAPGQWLLHAQVDPYPQGKGVTNRPIDPTTGKPYFDYSQGKSTMATDPRQEQIMQLAQVIRQMGMPNPNTRTTDIMGPPPGGYQQTKLNRPDNVSDRQWADYLAKISATDRTITIGDELYAGGRPGSDFPYGVYDPYAPSGPLTSTTEEQWQQQLQPYGPQVGGNVSTQPIESQYLDFARQQKGWNPAWNDYLPQLLRKLQNPDVNPTEGYVIGTQPGVTGGGRRVGIPQELWSQIAEFAKTIPGMQGREWQGPYKVPGGTPQNPYAGTQYGSGQLSSISQKLPRIEDLPGWKDLVPAQQRLLKDAGAWDLDPAKLKRFFSGGGGNPWTGVSIGPNGEPTYDPNFQPYYPPGTAFTQPTESGQSPSVLSDLARKNAIRRQVLAKLMGRPTGANSLMELIGQQQPY